MMGEEGSEAIDVLRYMPGRFDVDEKLFGG